MRRFIAGIFCALAAASGAALPAADLEPCLKTLLSVGPHGKGQAEAARAWPAAAKADVKELPQLLLALDRADPLAANWIRTAIDAAAERGRQRGEQPPLDELQRFLGDVRHAPHARRLAFELIAAADSASSARLIPTMLDDPSVELRRDAVALVLDQAKELAKTDAPRAKEAYRKAFEAARDLDQVQAAASRLRALGETVDLTAHFGFLIRWRLIAPFDNRGEKGFDAVYAPEKELRFDATYPGKDGPVKWFEWTSPLEMGQIDFHKAISEQKGVVGYAATEFIADAGREVEFRLTTFNAAKLWLNGKLLDVHKVYHGGSQFDQYVCRAALRPGKNGILLKICQNEQTQEWARNWNFQLRVCDALGTAVLSADRKQP